MTAPAWLKGSLILAVTLAAGIVIGIIYQRSRIPMHAMSATHHMMQRLTNELGLDPSQQKAVAAIFARRQATVDSTWHELQPQVRAAMDSTMREILDVLRPDQAAKYRKMLETRHPGTLR
jgi:hypothetical protein